MNIDEYQQWTGGKWNDRGIDSLYSKEWVEQLLNASTGEAGEAGELIDLVKKIAFHRLEVTPEIRLKIKKELGDKLYYLARTARLFGFFMSTIMEANVVKLENRYPNGFDAERANNKHNIPEE